MAGEDLFERVGDLADRGARARRLDRQRQEIALAALRRLGQRGERGLDAACVARLADPLRARAICRSRTAVLSTSRSSTDGRLGRAVFVDPDDRSPRRGRCAPGAAPRLPRCAVWACRSRPPWSCRPAPRPRRSAPSPPRRSNGSGSRRNSCRRADRRHAGCRSPRRGSAGCCGRSAPRPGSASASASSKELVCSDCVPPSTAASASIVGADDVVVRVLLGQADARGLAMRAQRQARRVLRRELLHQLRPQQPRGAQLGDLHEEIHADAEEEREPRREIVDRRGPATAPRAHIRARRPR